MDLYVRLGKQLRSLFAHPAEMRKEMDEILAQARLIGGTVHFEAEQLAADVERYLKNPKDKKAANKMKKHALKLEQETRQL